MYTLKKSKHLFLHTLRLYRKKKKRLSSDTRAEIKGALSSLQNALMNQDRKEAESQALHLQELTKRHLKKTFFEQLRDALFALGFALVVAVVIRSMWFELFEIPTGSMRPTFQEKDRLVVSKTAFGLNIPLMARHFYFDPKLVKRSGIVIFTGANMDIPHVDTLYFYLFPGKKQYVKRLIGKPGDTLYFYGGRIYGIDREGRDISSTLQLPSLANIDHIPYIRLEGETSAPPTPLPSGVYSPVTLKQMNQPVAKLRLKSGGRLEGNLLPPYEGKIDDYYQLFGFENYGMSRLLTQEEVLMLTKTSQESLEEAPLYLEIIHHPSSRFPLITKELDGKLTLSVGTNSTVIPLQDDHLKTLFNSLYTARFIAKNSILYRYGSSIKPGKPCYSCPKLPSIPNGIYEFYYGKGYEIKWGGIRKELPSDHPLMTYSPSLVRLFYNLGIEFNDFYSPRSNHLLLLPSRYTYYRKGDLYTMGAPLLKQGDPTLTRFIEREKIKESTAPKRRPYHPFVDAGPPLNADGELDTAFIRRYGVSVPEKHYFVLGDNYAMSSDSRAFGFVPEDNLRGVPLFLFWPPGSRLGALPQANYPAVNLPKAIVWGSALIICFISIRVHRKRRRLPLTID